MPDEALRPIGAGNGSDHDEAADAAAELTAPRILHDLDPALGAGVFGNVDSVGAEGVVGWLIDVADPTRVFHIDAQLDGGLVGVSETYLERPDVGTLLGRTAHCGFSLPWDRERLARVLFDHPDTEVLTLELIVRGEGRSIGAATQLPVTELRTWLAALPQTPEHYAGRLESLSPFRLSGYIIDRTSPNTPVALDVMLDGTVVGRTTADRERPDLLGSGIRLPCGFEWTVPHSLHDGRTARIDVIVGDSDYLLPGSGASLIFPSMEARPVRELRFAPGSRWIRGWAVDTQSDEPLRVHLSVDGKAAGSALAGTYEPELTSDPNYTHENRHTCFSFPTPRAVLDGWPHEIGLSVASWPEQPADARVTWACGEYFGKVERCANGEIGGWVAFRREPVAELRALPVEILAGGQVVGHCFLGESPVNADAGGAGYQSAWPFHGSMGRHLGAEITARYAGVDLRSPSAAETPAQKLRGQLDGVTRELISGWAVNVSQPEESVELELVVDSQVIASFRPSVYRRDVLNTLKLRTGNFGFSMRTPEFLLDGSPHRVDVRFTANRVPLGGKSHEVLFKPNFRGLPANDPHPVLSEFIGHVSQPPAVVSGKPLLSIVVLNRNGESILDALFASFVAVNSFKRYEFIVVDHASKDASIAILEKWRARGVPVTIVALPYNGSFSSSNNLAISKYARGEYVLLLNNDIVFVHDLLPELVRSLKDAPAVGLAGIKLLDVVEDRGVNFYPPIQHLGIRFGDFGKAGILPYDEKLSPDSAHEAYRACSPAGVTGAAMLCRREEYLALGGLDEAYVYGYEDVDLCLKYQVLNRQQIVCRNDLQALHHRGYSRLSGRELGIFERLDRNHVTLMRRWGYAIRANYRRSLMHGDRVYSSERLRIALAVTDTAPEAAAPDYRAALELAQALTEFPHVEPVFLSERDNWYDLDRVHVLVVMRHDYDLRSIDRERSALVKVAWLREPAASWLQQRWFDDFDVYLSAHAGLTRELSGLGYRCESLPDATDSAAGMAAHLMDTLRRYTTDSFRFAIKVPLATGLERKGSADWQLANSLRGALKALGHSVRIDLSPEWTRKDAADDVVIVLRGAAAYTPDTRQINLLWLLSNPEEVSVAECGSFDHVFCASVAYTAHLQSLGVTASTLLPGADPGLARAAEPNAVAHREHLYVGDAPAEGRGIVQDLIGAGVEVAIFGRDWDGRVPEQLVEGECPAAEALATYYSNAAVVYLDHPPEMARWGFLSSRLFDAAACGAYIVCDRVAGLDEAFGGLIATYETLPELAALAGPAGRGRWQPAQAQALRELVLSRHTITERAATLINQVRALSDAKLSGRVTALEPGAGRG
jgi:GT2 family glycosyltransferase